jgi:predicted transcriptional regulator
MNDIEIEFMRNNYKNMSSEELAKALNMSISMVYTNLKKINLYKTFRWNDERIAILKEIYPTGNWTLLYEKLGFDNYQSIIHKACKLGIKVDGDYLQEEVDFMIDAFGKLSLEEIAQHLNRSPAAVYGKMNKLGLKTFERWTDEEMKLLAEVYPNYTNKYLSEKFFPNRKAVNIRSMALKNGYHKSEEKSVKWYDKEKMIAQLQDLAKELDKTPGLGDLVPNGLPSSKSYERYFGGYRNACELAGLDINVNLFGVLGSVQYSLNGDICFSKAEKVVTDFFIENDIEYKKEELYRDYTGIESNGFKRVDWIIGDNIFIEYFGLSDKDYYYQRMEEKRMICRDCNIILMELYRKDLKNLHNIFKDFIN